MKKRILLLTGNPGIGKTTLLLSTIDSLKTQNFNIGGITSREIRENEVRVGFELSDIAHNRRGWLARVDRKPGPRIGKYRVVMESLDEIGAQAILNAIEESDIVAVDEIGPMELLSDSFKQAVEKAIDSDKMIIGVIHRNVTDALVRSIRMREDSRIVTITLENRNRLKEALVREVNEFMHQPK